MQYYLYLIQLEQFVDGFVEITGQPQGQFGGRDELVVLYCKNRLSGSSYTIGQFLLGNMKDGPLHSDTILHSSVILK